MTDKELEAGHLFRGYPGRACWDCGIPRAGHVEPTCQKCIDVIELVGQPEAERYQMKIENPDGTPGSISWNVGKARAMVKFDPRPTRRLANESLAAWLAQKAPDIVQEHLDHIPQFPDRGGSDPGLMVVIDELDSETGGFRPVPILIDGTHRAARAVRDGVSFFVYVLTDAEMMAAMCDVTNTTVYEKLGEPAADLAGTGIQATEVVSGE